MLNIKRQILLALLNQTYGLRSVDLASQLNVTQRTIRNNIKQINHNFKQQVIVYQKPYFKLIKPQHVINYITVKQVEPHYPNYTGDRPFLAFFTLYKHNWTKIDTLAAALHVGRNETEKTVKKLRQLLPKQIQLIASKKGIYLAGDSVWQNYMLAFLAVKRISRLVRNQYLNLIFGIDFNLSEFKRYLSKLDKHIQQTMNFAANDRALYILTIMHFLAVGNSLLLQATAAFQNEYLLANNNLILKIPATKLKIQPSLQKLFKLHPHHEQYLFHGIGNLINHMILAQQPRQYFDATIKQIKLNGLTIKYTELDEAFITHIKQLAGPVIRKQIVIYDPDISCVSYYQDQLQPLSNLFSDLDIQVTTNLFMLNQLLHKDHQETLFLAKRERISLADQDFNIHFIKLDTQAKFEILQFLLKSTN